MIYGNREVGKSKYYSLYLSIRKEILRGKIKAGQKLPSKRALAREEGVSVVTVQLAYEQLLAEGYVRAEERRGYFAEEVITPQIYARYDGGKGVEKPACNCADVAAGDGGDSAEKFRLDLVKGYAPAQWFPFATWAKLMRAVLTDCGEHLLERVPCFGDLQLRKAGCEYIYRTRGVEADPQCVVIGAGAEHLYGIVAQLLGRGRTVAVENPCYGKIPAAYALYGVNVLPVNTEKDGIRLEEIEACEAKASAVHVSPSHQFPTGAVMPAAARSRLVAFAESCGGYIIEDDYDSEFRLEGRPLQSLRSLCPERVIYINTFSKSLAPSMRLGYMLLPPALCAEYARKFGHGANIVPLFEQKALAAMIEGGYLERHVSRLKNRYRAVRALIRQKLADCGCECNIFDTAGGPHMVVEFPQDISDFEIKRKAAEAGARIKCLSDYLIAPREGVERRAVINYSGITEEDVKNF